MENRIEKLFQQKKKSILSIFFTAGFPKANDTIVIANALQQAGVDMIEIGIPFSDPVADGPTIQASNKVSIDNGMTVHLLLAQVKEIRKTVNIPIILMGYLNPVYQYGVERFIRDAKLAGADGLILPDLPLGEYEKVYEALMKEVGLSMSFLLSPTTTEERKEKIDSLSSGFIYAVSSSSTTGTRKGFTTEQLDYFAKLKATPFSNQYLIGFGISDYETFSTACQYAAGAIIGSAFIKMLESSQNIEQDIQQFVNTISQSK